MYHLTLRRMPTDQGLGPARVSHTRVDRSTVEIGSREDGHLSRHVLAPRRPKREGVLYFERSEESHYMAGQQLWRHRLRGAHRLLPNAVEVEESEPKRPSELGSRRVHDGVQPSVRCGELDQSFHQAFSFVGNEAIHDVPGQHDVVGLTWAGRQPCERSLERVPPRRRRDEACEANPSRETAEDAQMRVARVPEIQDRAAPLILQCVEERGKAG